uniref:Putative endonuclease-reverse transcriptase n=1 Tax=Amblyomma triste TaxID=251400 RepID=A0A023G128_AMBTT
MLLFVHYVHLMLHYIRCSVLSFCLCSASPAWANVFPAVFPVFPKRGLLKLRTTQRAMERKMVGVTLRDRKRAELVREITQVTEILVEIKKKKWTWTGHLVRREDNRSSLRVTNWIRREGKRSRGPQKVRWADEIKKFAGVK